MRLTSGEYYNLNSYGALHILLIIRIFLGVFSALGSAATPSFLLAPDYQSLPGAYGILLVLLIVCIILFFMKNSLFLLVYGGSAILVIGLNIWIQNYTGAGVSAVVEGLFLLYLILAKRSKVVFKTTEITITDAEPDSEPPAAAQPYTNVPTQTAAAPAEEPQPAFTKPEITATDATPNFEPPAAAQPYTNVPTQTAAAPAEEPKTEPASSTPAIPSKKVLDARIAKIAHRRARK